MHDSSRSSGGRIPVKLHRRVCLVQTEDALLAEELLARKKLSQEIVGRLSDRVLLIRDDRDRAFRHSRRAQRLGLDTWHFIGGTVPQADINLMDSARREAMDALVNAAIDKDLLDKAGQQAATMIAGIVRGLGFEEIHVYATLPPIGAHFEDLQDPSLIARLKAETPPLLPRTDQAGD